MKSHPRLKLYCGPEEVTPEPTPSPRAVTVRVGDVLPLLADAVASRRTWLEDFSDDSVTLPTDLYEVLLAYRYFRRPSA